MEFRQRTLNHQLKKIGFGGLEDPQLVHQLAFCVRDHEHFRKILAVVEPDKRLIAYQTMRPHLNFEAWPLDRYIIAAKQEAEELQLPVTLKDGSVVAYKDYHEDRPSLEVLAERAIKQAEEEKLHKALILTCSKCTYVQRFPAHDTIAAYASAKKAGWVFSKTDVDGTEKEIAVCPTCPAVRVDNRRMHAGHA